MLESRPEMTAWAVETRCLTEVLTMSRISAGAQFTGSPSEARFAASDVSANAAR